MLVRRRSRPRLCANARRAAGALRPDQKLAVLAAKFTEVRDSLPALIAAGKTLASQTVTLYLVGPASQLAGAFTQDN